MEHVKARLQWAICHESGVTGFWEPQQALPSPSPAYGSSSSLLPQPRSCATPRRLTQSYCSVSDIPQTRPTAGLDPSSYFRLGMLACASFPLLSPLCCLRVISPVIITYVVSLWLCLRVLSLFPTACVSFLLLPRIECSLRGG